MIGRDYDDVPGTYVLTAAAIRDITSTFCMSLNKANAASCARDGVLQKFR